MISLVTPEILLDYFEITQTEIKMIMKKKNLKTFVMQQFNNVISGFTDNQNSQL